MTSPNRGATPQEWYVLDFELGLGANLLPCAQADAVGAPGSKIEQFGKVPSAYVGQGNGAYGLKGWQKREILPNELALWRKDSRHNICVRTGPISGVYCLDIDVDDREKSEEIVALIEKQLGVKLPRRYRENSGKCLLMFRLEMDYLNRTYLA